MSRVGVGKKALVWILSTLLFVGCATFFKEEEEKKNTQLDYPQELEGVQDLYVAGRPVDALSKLDQFVNDSEKIHWFGHAYFLKAYIYESTGELDKAIKMYREAIDHGSQYESEVEAKALYNLSYVYERIGEMQKMLVSLVDLSKRKKFFSPFIARVEIPARLAAVYASMGRLELAQGIHEDAKDHYEKMIRRNQLPSTPEEHSKILFYLGLSSFDQNDENFTTLLPKLRKGQKYYLYSAEASNSPWAKRSRERLRNQYAKLWGFILNYEPKNLNHDSLAFSRNKQEKQLDRAADMYDLMYQLRAEEFPLASVNKNSGKIMAMSQDWLEKIEKFTLGLDLGPAMVRNKKIRNRRLIRYVEEEQKPVVINKESQQTKKAPSKKNSNDSNTEGSALPEKESSEKPIGQDPNL